MAPNLQPFLAGAVTMGFGLAGLGFVRLWARSGDRLFLAFAGAFWLLMLPPVTAVVDLPDQPESWVYLFRVAAYGLIIVAVLLKNRQRLGRIGRADPWTRR